MSTRARVGITIPEGIESIYVHFDGYPEGVGQKLLDHWTEADKVRQLIDLGDLSQLGEEIGEKHDFDTYYGSRPEAELAMCLAYGRDRGEEDVTSVKHPEDAWPDYGQEYEYLAVPDLEEVVRWQVREVSYGGQPRSDWRQLAIVARLEYLRGELRAERLSYGELAELQGLAEHISPGDVELLEAAGVPEFP